MSARLPLEPSILLVRDRLLRNVPYLSCIPLKRAFRSPGIVLGCTAAPAALLWLLTQLFGKLPNNIVGFSAPSYLAFAAPVIGISAALPYAALAGVQLLDDRDCGMNEQLMSTPSSISTMLTGVCIALWAQSVTALIVVWVVAFIGGFRPGDGLTSLVCLLPIGLAITANFAGLSFAFAVAFATRRAAAIAGRIVLATGVLTSNFLLPRQLLPHWLVTVSAVNPLTYGIDAARSAETTHPVWADYLSNLGVVLAAAAICLGFAYGVCMRHGNQRLILVAR